MTTLEFQGHSFSIENDAKRFLEKYLKRIDSYAQKHHIDTDVVDDIYQSILEKLFEIKKPISQKKLITIVNALWEPEDIFENNEMIALAEAEMEGKKGRKKFLFQIQQGIKKIWYGFRMAIKRICLSIRRLVKWTCILARRLVKRCCIRGRSLLKRISIQLRRVLKRCRDFLYKFFTSYLRKFLWACVRIFFWCVLLCGIVVLVGLVGAWVGDITVMNQSFRLLFENDLTAPLCVLLVCCSFWFITLLASFSKKPIKNRYLHLWVLLMALGGGIAILSSACELLNMQRYHVVREIELPKLNVNEVIEIWESRLSQWNSPFLQRRYHLGTEIKAEVEFYYYAKNPEQAKLIEQAFIAPEMITVGNKIIAEWRDNQIFSPKVPFNAIEVYLDFSVPENAKLKSDYRRCRQDHGIWEGGKFVCPEETRES